MKRIAFYGGSFDPVHNAHLALARAVVEQFELDEFVFVPAFHAPHKVRLKPTSAYDRYAMLCLLTANRPNISVSKIEIGMPEKPYSVETLKRIKAELTGDKIFFVIGADSWMDIKNWREWQTVLLMTNIIVMTRPGYEISFDHVTDEIRNRIIDLRGHDLNDQMPTTEDRIFVTDAVNLDVSATKIRRKIREVDASWRDDVPKEVANYIEKYQIYS
ncbi:MAG: nicotinate-nucleotide adenylyltransferase [Pyrinomonadaceae bacterium]